VPRGSTARLVTFVFCKATGLMPLEGVIPAKPLPTLSHLLLVCQTWVPPVRLLEPCTGSGPSGGIAPAILTSSSTEGSVSCGSGSAEATWRLLAGSGSSSVAWRRACLQRSASSQAAHFPLTGHRTSGRHEHLGHSANPKAQLILVGLRRCVRTLALDLRPGFRV
jgi:hypothetical protein